MQKLAALVLQQAKCDKDFCIDYMDKGSLKCPRSGAILNHLERWLNIIGNRQHS